MNTLESTALAYQERARHSITYHVVSDPHFEAYFDKVGTLRRYERDHGLDDEWHGVVNALSRYRYDASHVPLPFNHPYFLSRLNLSEIEYTISRSHITRPSLAEPAKSALQHLKYLVANEANPILDAIDELLPDGRNEEAAIVLAHSRFKIPLGDFLKRQQNTRYGIVDPNVLRRLLFWERLVYVGAVRDFDDYVFSSPRTHITEVVGFRWQQGKWDQTESFLGGVTGRSSVRQRFTGSSSAQAAMLANVDIDAVEFRLREAPGTEPEELALTSNKVDARLHELFGGKAVLLEASDRRTNMVIDLDADHDDRVRQVADRDIEEGMFIVLRTGERGGYLVPIADQIIGDRAVEYRFVLNLWKTTLRTMESQYGPQGLVNRLLRAGSTRATYQNARNWMSSQTIAPEATEDYRAIAVVCGMEHHFPSMVMAAREIRRAHVHAGQRVRRMLLDVVHASDIESIEREGMKQFELDDFEGARLTAYRIEGRADRTSAVSASSLERVFDLDIFTR